MSSHRVLGIIPARGGSKRIPNKNLRLLAGSPLISYTIRAAQAATKLTDYVVATDSQEIANVAKSYGAPVLMRPAVPDDQTSGEAIAWVLDHTDLYYGMIVLLHPTSPIRDPKHIDQAIEMLAASNAPSLASVECKKRTYTHNASIYAIRREAFNGEHYSEQSIPFLMDKRHSLDVNDELDLKLAELMLNAGNY